MGGQNIPINQTNVYTNTASTVFRIIICHLFGEIIEAKVCYDLLFRRIVCVFFRPISNLMKLFRWKLEALSTLSCMSRDRYINILVQITPPGSLFDKLHWFQFSDQRTPDCDYIRGHGINKRQSHLNKSCVSKSKTKV